MATGADGDPAGDLTAEELEALLPDRPIRSYPAVVSTEADAMKWARAGAPEGAVVAADYQIAPRGRGGRAWDVQAGRGLVFSLVLRPSLPPEREGWLHTVAVSGLADALDEEADGQVRVLWPDEVLVDGDVRGSVTVHVELGPRAVAWAVASFHVGDARPPRGPLLARTVRAVEARAAAERQDVLAAYEHRCRTLGMKVRLRLVPVGPAGPSLEGMAVDCLDDGALVIETDRGNRVAVRPQNLGEIEETL